MPCEFVDPGDLIDGDLRLDLVEKQPPKPAEKLIPGYIFHMKNVLTGERMGSCSLRFGDFLDVIRIIGHIGFRVEPPYRGQRYATRATRLLIPLAWEHGINPLWVTANPENAASRRSIELAGGKFIGEIDTPPDHFLYQRGFRRKCQYLIRTS